MPKYWKIRAGEKGFHWKSWKANSGIITIGWNIGKLEELSLEETRRKIEEIYPDNDPYQVASMIRRFTGVAEGKPCISKGDIVIVLGDAEVLDIAEIKEEKYRYEPQAIPTNETHTYWRTVKYRNYEPVKLRNLPPKFQQGGDASLHLPRTLMHYKYGEDNIGDLEQIMKASMSVTVWVEKTYIEGRGDEQDPSFGFSNSLWSPLKSIDGKNIYRNMRDAKSGDVIIHLARNSRESSEPYTLQGVSVVSKEAEIFDMPPNTEWGDKWRKRNLDPKGYLIQLRDYRELEKHLHIGEFLEEPKYADALKRIVASKPDLFFSKLLRPNQGKYLSKAPSELVSLLNDFCYTETEKYLPHLGPKTRKEETSEKETFAFTEKDFDSCTGKKKDTEYLGKRFKELERVLKSTLDPNFQNFEWWIPRLRIRGTNKFRSNMWVGLGDTNYLLKHKFVSPKKKRLQPRRGVQLQVGIDKSDPFFIEIFIDSYADKEAKIEAKRNLEQNTDRFLKQVNELKGFVIGHSSSEWKTEAFSDNDLQEFLDNFDEHTYIGKHLSKEEVIAMDTKIIDEILMTWKAFLPTYNLMISGFEPPLQKIEKVSITHLLIGRNVIFYGPPGTGKTRMARTLARRFCGDDGYLLQTGNAEWTVYDVIGGPTLNNLFKPGFLSLSVKRCEKSLESQEWPYWLILDELNRANLDLGFGKIFTLLDLDYREKQNVVDVNEVEGFNNAKEWEELEMPLDFRILATMNSYDRALLFSLGFAFRRRFAFVEVPSPFKKTDSQPYQLKDAIWKEEIERVSGRLEAAADNIKQEIKTWISKGKFLPLKSSLKKAIELSEDLKDRFLRTNEQTLAGEFDPYDIYSISLRLADYVTGNRIIDLGYAQPIDLIKFAITYLALFPSEDPRKTVIEAMDEAVQAYFIPQMEYFLPKVRREMTIGEEGEEKQEEKLKKLIEYLRNLGLEKSAAKLEDARDRLKFGEIRIL